MLVRLHPQEWERDPSFFFLSQLPLLLLLLPLPLFLLTDRSVFHRQRWYTSIYSTSTEGRFSPWPIKNLSLSVRPSSSTRESNVDPFLLPLPSSFFLSPPLSLDRLVNFLPTTKHIPVYIILKPTEWRFSHVTHIETLSVHLSFFIWEREQRRPLLLLPLSAQLMSLLVLNYRKCTVDHYSTWWSVHKEGVS